MWRSMWDQLMEKHRRATLCTLAACVLGIIYLFFGLFHMLIFGLIVYTGYYIGNKLDRNEPVFPAEDVWRRLMDKWRLFR
ncbi:Small integral membrane protein [Paenibacillus sp. UNCCL117]|uniref:DUF2273 domain-containing protein n=2 Tax=unclassified Paenibacillus TaxID=185978 RepID=UPI0008841765|nr:Small integral membrane protein [Paenibacillus sp. cl123]SFW47160.1 Small integral membrane protein [Paenibacillus sp. UNCCL117]